MLTKAKVVDISRESNYQIPEDLFAKDDYVVVQTCYQYRTANESDSPLSLRLDTKLTTEQKDKLWKELMSIGRTNDAQFIIVPILRNKIATIQSLLLSDTTLKCDGIKGFVQCKKGQHKIDALFKRMRDSFAHGRIGQNNGYLILEDKTNELTGRIIITIQVLLDWVNTIDSFLQRECIL